MSRALAIVLCMSIVPASVALAQPPEKKLIEYGWDLPQPGFIADNIAQMEQRPFDGLIFNIRGANQIFMKALPDEAEYQADLASCARIQWGKFTDNFIVMFAASDTDWFSDADWDIILRKTGMTTEAAKAARCVGICFDHEPYGFNPWEYAIQAQAATKTFPEYQTMVRLRGRQFMERIQQVMPTAVVHTFFQLSYFAEIARLADEDKRQERLSTQAYGLLPSFLNGMLDVMAPGVTMTDGNESAYYYTSSEFLYQAFHNIHQTALALVAPENRVKYLSQMQCAQAMYVDYVFRYWPYSTPADDMTEAERAQWWEHNIFYALTTSDRYVWLYSEKMNWWTNVDLPPGMEQATASARDKVNQRKPLGFELATVMDGVKQRQEARLQARLFDRTATIPRVAAADRPTIDGKFGDACWQKVSALEAFVPWATSATETAKAETLAWVAADADNLYLAVRCQEPNLDALKINGTTRDGNVWEGDSVDIFVSTAPERIPFYHFIFNPANVRFDATQVSATDVDRTWDPVYQSATGRGDGFWSLELAIPWSALGLDQPAAGTALTANICRNRQAAEQEYTCWNPCIRGFQEPKRFGVWTLQ